jgi:hypothetical protein
MRMVIWSPQKLEQQIANEELTPWEKTRYLILALVVGAASGPMFWIAPTVKAQNLESTALIQVLATLLGLLITFRGIKRCYETNNIKPEFINRFICIRIPWDIRFGIILAPLSLIIIYTANKFFPLWNDLAYIIIYICSPLITFIYYKLLNRSFDRILNMQSRPSSKLDQSAVNTPLVTL